MTILSTPQGAPHILSFSIRDLKGEIMINAFQKRGVIVSTSSACSSKQTKTSHVVEALNIDEHFKKRCYSHKLWCTCNGRRYCAI